MKLHGWLFPDSPDVLGVLRDHAGAVSEGLAAFARWAATGDADEAQAVRDLEHRADGYRRTLGDLLHDLLTTPIDRETLFVLGERLDGALNHAKNLVRIAQVAGWGPDEDLGRMADHVAEASRHVRAGMEALGRDHEAARLEAAHAVHCVRAVEHCYRDAVGRAQAEPDVRMFVVRMDMYRHCMEVADALEETARRLAYAVLKGL